MKTILLGLLTAYRYAISPMLGRHCRFEPSCSVYAQEAVQEFGAARGTYLAARRVCRCHPWHPGGYDPLPPRA
ncbi:MAG: membrane protein insertion efficiency factor YidD [Burkholderiales bacterium]